MNKAHKRTWMNLAVSAAGILMMTGALAVIEMNDLRLENTDDHMVLRVLGLLCTIPLILLVILNWCWRKAYDERDMHIERRSQMIGGIATLVFLGAGAFILVVTRPRGAIGVYFLPSLVYVTCFVYWLVSCIATLIQYGCGDRDE